MKHIAPTLRRFARPLSSLVPDPANLRLHGERSVEAIAASLARFGQQKPIVVDASGVVIAGNGMLEAAKRLGWSKIAAVRSDLGGVERVAYGIADNRTPEHSSWDAPALREVLRAMPEEAALAAGFSQEEIDALLAPPDDTPVQEHAPPAVLPKAVTRPGDLWTLGTHRLLCGDSTRAEDVDRLMDGRRASLVATDPPYLVDYTGKRAGGRGKDWSEHYREVEVGDAAAFYRDLYAQVVRVVAPNAALYCWHAHKRIPEILAAWRGLGILDHQQIIWIKPTIVFGSVFWHFRHEPCLMGWVQGSKPTHDGKHGEGSVWTAAGQKTPLEDLTRDQLVRLLKDASSAWEVNWEGRSRSVGAEHPTQKPVELFARPIRKHTKLKDVVYEPFSGSGSQIVAAEQLGRACYAMEIEPVFVDVAIRRWQVMTGRRASLAGGPTWERVAEKRRVAVREVAQT